MLVANVLGSRYHRTLLEDVDVSSTIELKSDFDYSFIVCYGEFSDAAYEVTEKTSGMLDLRGGIEPVIAGFNSTSRNEYRRSFRMEGFTFKHGIDNFDSYYRFYSVCEKERQWLPIPPDEMKNSLVFTAYYNDQPISGMSCYKYGTRIRVGRIYSRKRSDELAAVTNTMFGSAAKRLVVEICQYAIENKLSTLDLGGVDTKEGSKSGITQFKLSLGCTLQPVKLGRFMKDNIKEKLTEIRHNGWDLT